MVAAALQPWQERCDSLRGPTRARLGKPVGFQPPPKLELKVYKLEVRK